MKVQAELYLRDPQKLLIGLGHPLCKCEGKCPGVLILCKPVDKRLAWTATRLPPTPATAKE